jgi:hypothetical protein
MTTLFQDTAVTRNLSLGYEGTGRPRAATVSFRYIAPHSPIYRPSTSPPQSPPSLILPPVRLRSGGLSRSFSRLSCLDERLASSAPSTSNILSVDIGGDETLISVPSFLHHRVEDSDSSPRFVMNEEEGCGWQYGPVIGRECYDGGRDLLQTETIPESSRDHSDMIQHPEFHSFSASPVLISCLRDMVKGRRAD